MSRPSSLICPRAGNHPGQRAQRRGLAGAVRAEQRDDRAVLDLEIDAVQDPDRAVARMQARAPAAPRVMRPPRDRRVTTAGLALTSAGVPSASSLPEMEHEQPPAQAHHQAHLVLDQQHRELELVADARDQVAELDRARRG